MASEKVQITFDESGNIRVLDPEIFRETEMLRFESADFIRKVRAFDESVTTLQQLLENQAKMIEVEKLKAVGERNLVEGELEARKKKQRELQTLINEKKQHLERVTMQLESLEKAEAEQKVIIEKLRNNEM